jgi:hypothetical protein
MALGFLIGNNTIQLSDLKRSLIALVPDAYSKSHARLMCSLHFSVQQRELDHLPPTNSVRLVPMDLRGVDRSIMETDRREALPLPPPPLAISINSGSCARFFTPSCGPAYALAAQWLFLRTHCPVLRATSRYETNANRLLSGDQDGTLIVPWPPKSVANTFGSPPVGMIFNCTSLFGGCPLTLGS